MTRLRAGEPLASCDDCGAVYAETMIQQVRRVVPGKTILFHYCLIHKKLYDTVTTTSGHLRYYVCGEEIVLRKGAE